MARNGALQVILGFVLKLESAELVLQVTASEAGPPSIPELILQSKPHICYQELVTSQGQHGNSPPRLSFSRAQFQHHHPGKVQVSLLSTNTSPEAPSFASRHQPGIQDPSAAAKWIKMSLSIWDSRNQPPSMQPPAQDPQADENRNVKVTAQVKSTTFTL